MAKEDKFDVAVIGAGPAGMIAAGIAAESGAKVILIEKNKQIGEKLLLTGNGRCNITNAEFNLRKLVENYGKDGKFLFHAFFVFGPKEVINFFDGLGVKTKIENDLPAQAGNRVFPVSEKSADVLNALKKYLLKNKVDISLDSRVSEVIFKKNRIEKLIVGGPSTSSGQVKEIISKKYIFCTGGKSYPITGSTGDGFKWANDLGHSISELSPALTPIKLKEDWVKDLQGLVLKNVKISVFSPYERSRVARQNNKKHFQETGDILFTHFGISGPTILDISKRIGKLLKQGEAKLCLDLFPNLNIEDLDKKIQEKINKNPKKSIKNLLADFIPQRFIPIFIKNLGIEAKKQVNNITKKEREAIAKFLKNIEVVATGLLGFDSAMVTSGGVLLKEIDHKTMKSKIIDNLFFAGEIIDVNGKTGGFNLQMCWSTGYVAGKAASKF